MSDTTETGRELATQDQTQNSPSRVRLTYAPVESAMGIMDTARFEHIGRVASVMAAAQLMPMTLTHVQVGKDGQGNPIYDPLPLEVVRARAYLIANQADLWHADPMAVAQCTSMVYGKMMYEGKLVHGIISARLGIDLRYDFGVYNPRTRNIDPMPSNGLENDNQSLGVRVSGTLPAESEPRWIAGSVNMWHKGAKSPWGAPNAWPRQLRYMGAREWCRAFKPSLLLGILTDDEVEEYDLGRQAGAVAPAAPQTLHAGFEDRRPAQVIEGPRKSPEEAKAGVAGKRAARAKAAALEATQSGVGDALEGDDIPSEDGARPTETAGAPAAEKAPATSETATDASTDGAEESPSQQGSSEQQDDGQQESEIDRINREAREQTQDVVEMGAPEPDEVYHLDGDVWSGGRRATYKNGEPFSSAGKGAGLKVYAEHAPEASDAQEDEGEESDFPPEFQEYIDTIEAAPNFADVKRAMQKFYTTEVFKAFSPEQQNKVRADTWATLVDRKLPLPDHASDVSAFRLWIEHEPDRDAIMGTLRALETDEAFQAKEPSFKQAIRQAVANRVSIL